MALADPKLEPHRKREKTGGRVKGTPNKLTADVKGMILEALNAAGGSDYLLAQASANPGPFMTLVGKVLPMTVSGDPDNPFVHRITREIVDPNPKD